MTIETLVKIPFTFERPTPPFEGNDIRYPEALVRDFLERFTKKGQRIFDPFAGLGTTLFVAEDMGRLPHGIEADRTRYEWVAGQMQNWQNLIHGDTAKLSSFDLPKMDFCMTSPPYMPRHHKWNPLFAGNPKHAGYDRYLKQMGVIFKQVAQQMKRGGHVVVQADNLQHGKIFTPLVHDLHTVITAQLEAVGETTIVWDKPKPDYPMTHCLIFRKK